MVRGQLVRVDLPEAGSAKEERENREDLRLQTPTLAVG